MRLRSLILRVTALSLAVFATSCVSTTTPKRVELENETRQLPFRVALVPVAPAEYAVEREAGDDQGLIDLAGAVSESGRNALTDHLHNSLEANVFNDVVILDPPAAGQASEAHWVNAARRAGADLLLDVDEVRYETEPKTAGLWSSYALYLTGPLEMLFADRTYDATNCVMEVSLYDVNLLDDVPGEGLAQNVALESEQDGSSSAAGDWRMNRSALLREFRVRPEKMRLRYGDRVKGGLGVVSMLKAFVIPSAFLSTDSEYVRQELSDRTALGLATSLSERIVEGDEVYIQTPSPRVARFHMREEPRVEWRNGVLYLKLAVDRYSEDRFKDGKLIVDGNSFDLEFEEARAGDPVRTRKASSGLVVGQGWVDSQADVSGDSGFVSETLEVLFDPVGAQAVEASFSNVSPLSVQQAPDWVQIVLEESAPGTQKQIRSWTVRPVEIE